MTARGETGEMAAGSLDPVIGSVISGRAGPNETVSVLVDGKPAGTAPAVLRRQGIVDPPADPCCGFRIPAPAALFDGAAHEVRALGADGRDLSGSPLAFRAGTLAGRVEGCRGSLLFGTVEAPAGAAAPPVLAAIMGDEVVALAVARPAPGEAALRFTFVLPPEALRSGHRLVRVALHGSNAFLDGSPFRLPAAREPAAVLRERRRPLTAAIKISAPNLRVAPEWGDYHFALALAAALERRGWSVRVDCNDDWKRSGDDVVLALRGRHRYPVRPDAINLLWIISHPDRMAPQEVDDYAHVFVASDVYAAALKPTTGVPVSVLHQCTDPAVFAPPTAGPAPSSRVLFVGNSRREFRTMVRWCVETGIDVDVFGSLWEGVIPGRLIRGRHIANGELHRWYGSGAIVLNDHWDVMREQGFLSNRLFDASAAGGFTITDPVKGLGAVFGDAIETASGAAELKRKVEHYLSNPGEAREKAERARSLVLGGHTFDHRADRIVETVKALQDSTVQPLPRATLG